MNQKGVILYLLGNVESVQDLHDIEVYAKKQRDYLKYLDHLNREPKLRRRFLFALSQIYHEKLVQSVDCIIELNVARYANTSRYPNHIKLKLKDGSTYLMVYNERDGPSLINGYKQFSKDDQGDDMKKFWRYVFGTLFTYENNLDCNRPKNNNKL
jgi:hypothetical protein